MLTRRKLKITRYPHQVSLARSYILLEEAFKRNNFNASLDKCIEVKREKSVQFNCWLTAMELQALVLMLVKNLCKCFGTDCTMDVCIGPHAFLALYANLHKRFKDATA